MFTNFSVVPLRFATVMGMVFAMIGIGLGVFIFYEKMVKPGIPIGWASTIFTISVFAGVQLMAIGLLGEYLGRAFILLGKKPQFTVRKSFTTSKEN